MPSQDLQVHIVSDDICSGSRQVISGSVTALVGHWTSISCELQCCRSWKAPKTEL